MQLVLVAIISIALLLTGRVSASEALVLNDSFSSRDLSAHIKFIEDKSNQLDLRSVMELDSSAWSSLPNNGASSANFGFSESSYWLSYTLKNIDDQNLDLLINLDYALLDSIDFYGISEGRVVDEYHMGDALPFDQRIIEYPTFVFPVELPNNATKRIITRVQSAGSLQMPLSVWIERDFLVSKQIFMFTYGAFLSALLIMSAYNLCLFAIIRDRSYLLYSVFILFMAGVHGSLDGFAYQWFWPDFPKWHQVSSLFFISLGVMATVLFTRSVLPIPKKSKLENFVKGLTYLTIVTVVASVFLPYRPAAMLNGVVTVVVMSGVCFTCIAMLKHSPRIARFYCFAWSVYFLGIVLKSASKMGYIPYSMFAENAANIGGVVGVIVISLALADRINSEKRAKESAQKQSIGNLQRFENLYQNALEGIFSFDSNGKLLSANPAFLKILGLANVDEFNRDETRSPSFNLPPNTFSRLVQQLIRQRELVNHELQIKALNGRDLWVNLSARLSGDALPDDSVFEGTIIDITDRKAFEEQLKHLASHDSLTGFLNRRAFEAQAKESLLAVQSYQSSCFLLYLDLDQFKIVNDLCGHTAGDVLLKNLSQRLINDVAAFGQQHTIARLGGDEFGILLAGSTLEGAQEIAESIRESIERFLFVWEGNRFTLGVSIGLVEICPFHHSVEQVLVMADTACYMAKDQGRNRVHTFIETDKEMQFRQLEMQWVSTIKEALKEDLFFLVFQRIASNLSSTESGYHYEILLRLMTSSGNLCGPNQFLPAAERYNLMPHIDRWVIEHYFKWLSVSREHMADLNCVSINLSTQSIGDEEFLAFLIEKLAEYGIPANKICFEITESMAISNIHNTHSFIDRLRSLGCRFALDDFGTGFSSYAYLKDLNVDYLKIDGVFIKNLIDDPINTAMVKSISDVAKAIGIETIAEFVETEEIREKLIDIGISYSQGYHIHKPEKLIEGEFGFSIKRDTI